MDKIIQRFTAQEPADSAAAEAKKLREQLVEYDEYLQGIRKVTLKNVDTLDALQRYTEKSAAGMQKLVEESLGGVERVTAESAQGLRRVIETGNDNLQKSAESVEQRLNQLTQDSLGQLQQMGEESRTQIQRASERNLETAVRVEEIEQAIMEHLEAVKELLKQSDDFTHRENVKVYRNVQAVVVEEVKKLTEALTSRARRYVGRVGACVRC